MKRPEYVAVVTGIYARAIREDREPTGEELEQLRAAFSRQGFTQGYYLDQQGPDMFGVREETREPKELFAAARNTYQSGEAQRVLDATEDGASPPAWGWRIRTAGWRRWRARCPRPPAPAP